MTKAPSCHTCGVAIGQEASDPRDRELARRATSVAALGAWCLSCESSIFCHAGLAAQQAVAHRLIAEVDGLRKARGRGDADARTVPELSAAGSSLACGRIQLTEPE